MGRPQSGIDIAQGIDNTCEKSQSLRFPRGAAKLPENAANRL
jgi:hypothetical protein